MKVANFCNGKFLSQSYFLLLILYFLIFLYHRNSEILRSPKQEAAWKNVLGATVVKYLEWLALKQNFTNCDEKLINLAIFNPSNIGFDTKNHLNLQKIIEPLLSHLSSSVLASMFNTVLKTVLEAFKLEKFDNKILEKSQGLNFIQRFRRDSEKFPVNAIQDYENDILKNIANKQFCEQIIDLACSTLEVDPLKFWLEKLKASGSKI